MSKANKSINSHIEEYLDYYCGLSHDPATIDPAKLRELIEHLETIAGIQQGFEELNSGQTRPIGNFIQEMQQKYDISG